MSLSRGERMRHVKYSSRLSLHFRSASTSALHIHCRNAFSILGQVHTAAAKKQLSVQFLDIASLMGIISATGSGAHRLLDMDTAGIRVLCVGARTH